MAEQNKPVTDAERISAAMVEAEKQAEERQADETVEGGKYKVGDKFVNADGEPLKDKG